MTRFLLRSSLTLSALLLHACTDDGPAILGSQVVDAGADAAAVTAADVLPPGCAPLSDRLPDTLSCTGLYGAAGTTSTEKSVPATNRAFTPSTILWTDGADKLRWIALPEGKQIDTSNANGWVFPDGTRVWKEFAFDGKRIETRFMYKSSGSWQLVSYQWNEAGTEATKIVQGADVPLAGGRIHSIPTQDQCNECHRGARDKVLGFQHVLLGLPEAKGLTLSALVAENRLSNPPARTSFTIPDDGTGMAGQVLPWIHVNCGVSCHNETGNAEANMSHMFLRIDPAQLDDPTPANWNMVKLTVGVPSATANFFGGARIVPGKPDESLIVELAETRGSNAAMPPLGTRIVDRDSLALVREWITRLGGPKPVHDAGPIEMDAGVGIDAAVPDAEAAGADAGSSDASSTTPEPADADLLDAEALDAESRD